jgi:hypothetical protein
MLNKADAGNGSDGISRVSNVLRSPSPDPGRQDQWAPMSRFSPSVKAAAVSLMGTLLLMVLSGCVQVVQPQAAGLRSMSRSEAMALLAEWVQLQNQRYAANANDNYALLKLTRWELTSDAIIQHGMQSDIMDTKNTGSMNTGGVKTEIHYSNAKFSVTMPFSAVMSVRHSFTMVELTGSPEGNRVTVYASNGKPPKFGSKPFRSVRMYLPSDKAKDYLSALMVLCPNARG